MPDLLMEYDELSIIQNGKQKVLKKYSSYELLILDEWLFGDFTENSIQFIFELIERHYDNTATIFFAYDFYFAKARISDITER